MSNFITYKNIIAYHPGYYIEDLLEELEITQEEMAYRLDITPKNLSELINGKTILSENIAIKLSVMLGTSIEIWLNLQNKYDLVCAEIKKAELQDNEKELLSYIDYNFFVKQGFVSAQRKWQDKWAELCKFLKVGTLASLAKPDLLVSYRKAAIPEIDKRNIICSNAWIQAVINKADDISVSKFDRNKLLEVASEIREMTNLHPDTYAADIKKKLSDCGVALVVLPSLKNSGVYGAIKWIDSNKVVLGITDRGKDIDKFWFSLFHEIGHILQPKLRGSNNVVISSKDYNFDDDLERDADNFAQNILIPKDNYDNFVKKGVFSRASILQFSWDIHIHPGIIVGRLQKDKKIPYSYYNDLKTQYDIRI